MCLGSACVCGVHVGISMLCAPVRTFVQPCVSMKCNTQLCCLWSREYHNGVTVHLGDTFRACVGLCGVCSAWPTNLTASCGEFAFLCGILCIGVCLCGVSLWPMLCLICTVRTRCGLLL